MGSAQLSLLLRVVAATAYLIGATSSFESLLTTSAECPIVYPVNRDTNFTNNLDSLISDSFAAYNNGLMYHQMENNTCSLFYYSQSIQIKPNFAEAYNNLALVYESIGYIHDALECHLKCIEYASDDDVKVGCLSNLGALETRLVNSEVGENHIFDSSRILYNEALRIDPSAVNVLSNLGLLLNLQGLLTKAFQQFKMVIGIDPNNYLANLNVGNHHFRSKNYPEAVIAYESTLAIKDDDAGANSIMTLNNLGQCYREMDANDKAVESFNRAMAILNSGKGNGSQVDFLALKQLVNFLHNNKERRNLIMWTSSNAYSAKTLHCDWNQFEEFEDFLEFTLTLYHDLLHYVVSKGMGFNIDPYTYMLSRFAPAEHGKMVSHLCCRVKPIYHYPLLVSPPMNRKLKVGYLSQDWRNHPMGRLTQYFVVQQSSKIDPYCLSYGNNDLSDSRRFVEANAFQFYDLTVLSEQRVNIFEFIHLLELDVLVDLTALTYNGKIEYGALKAAPVVINYLGYPGTTGCIGFDFTIADKITVPPEYAASQFTEKLIYIPYSYQANKMPYEVLPCGGHNRKLCQYRMQWGLVEDQRKSLLRVTKRDSDIDPIWLCSFNAKQKIEPLIFTAWMNILRRVPYAVFFMISNDQTTHNVIYKLASFHGITKNRIIFMATLDWKAHLFRASSCDLVLDTFNYGAHTTYSDMLWMWIPVISLASWGSNKMPSRIANSILSSLPATDSPSGSQSSLPVNILLVQSAQEYEDVAVRLISSTAWMMQLRSVIGDTIRNSAIFAYREKQQSLELSYQLSYEVKVHSPSTESTFHIFPSTSPIMAQEFIASEIIDDLLSWLQNWSLEALAGCKDHMNHRIFFPASKRQELFAYFLRLVGSRPIASLVNDDRLRRHPLFTEVLASLGAIEVEYVQTVQNTNASELDSPREVPLAIEKQINPSSSDSLTDTTTITDSVTKKILNSLDYNDVNRIFRGNVEYLLHQATIDPSTNLDSLFSQMLNYLFVEHRNASFIKSSHQQVVNAYNLREQTHCLPILQRHERRRTAILIKAVQDSVKLLNMSHSLRFYKFELSPQMFNSFQTDANCEIDILANIAFYFNQFGIYHHLRGSHRQALVMFMNAYLYEPQLETLKNIGIILQDFKLVTEGFSLIEESILLQHEESFQEMKSKYIEWEVMETDRNSDGLSIAIFCEQYGQDWFQGWGPSNISSASSGVGGSEEAVIHVSRELAMRGHSVTVYGDPSSIDLRRRFNYGNGTVLWMPISAFDIAKQIDVFVAWRYAVSLAFGRLATKCFLWLHDLIAADTLPPATPMVLHGVFVQSEFHRDFVLSSIPPTDRLRWNVKVAPNGVSTPEDFQLNYGPRDNSVFIYASSPARSLEHILELWPKLKLEIPNAILKVFYGFSESVRKQLTNRMGSENFDIWYQKMQGLLLQDGVQYYGSISHIELRQQLSEAGFLLYPTKFPETGCITVLKAMTYGAIPITSRYTGSVLANLSGEFDLGPEVPLTTDTDYALYLQDMWLPSVVAASRLHEDTLMDIRSRMMKYSHRSFSWSFAADIMHKEFVATEN